MKKCTGCQPIKIQDSYISCYYITNIIVHYLSAPRKHNIIWIWQWLSLKGSYLKLSISYKKRTN